MRHHRAWLDAVASGISLSPTMTRWRMLCLIGLFLLPLSLTGCGGETAPAGYLCLLGRSATDNGCYRAVAWAAPSPFDRFHDSFMSVSTDVLIVPMACSGDCLLSATRDPAVAGSGATATGGISNYLQLSDSAQNYFIRLGYGAIGGDGTPTYFVDYRFPILNTADGSFTAGYRRVLLSPTGVPPAPSDGYRFAHLEILGGTGDGGIGVSWYACVSLPATGRPNAFQQPMCSPIGLAYVVNPDSGRPEVNSFAPNTFSLGQHVYGSSGASAALAAFTNTRYSHAAAIDYGDGTGAQQLDENWQVVGNDWALQASTPAAVPFAGWLITPRQSPSHGGMFYVECCRPLHS